MGVAERGNLWRLRSSVGFFLSSQYLGVAERGNLRMIRISVGLV
jgi:hypothetical protein